MDIIIITYMNEYELVYSHTSAIVTMNAYTNGFLISSVTKLRLFLKEIKKWLDNYVVNSADL